MRYGDLDKKFEPLGARTQSICSNNANVDEENGEGQKELRESERMGRRSRMRPRPKIGNGQRGSSAARATCDHNVSYRCVAGDDIRSNGTALCHDSPASE